MTVARIIWYSWFTLVTWITAGLPDFKPILKLRGLLVRMCFRSCGRNVQIGGGVHLLFTTRVDVGDNVYIAHGCWLNSVGGITLEDEVMLGPYTVLATTNHTQVNGSYRFGPGDPAPIRLRRGAWTGAHAVVTAGVTIGKGSAVAAGAVVTSDVADQTVVGGVPACVLRRAAPATQAETRP